MILIDANLLIYAHIDTSPAHEQAKQWLDIALSGPEPAGIPWLSLLAFMRVVTNPRATAPPIEMSVACSRVEEWLAHEFVWIPQPTEQHGAVLTRLLRHSRAVGNLVSDAHLATLAIEHHLTLYSADSDFARFPGLRWINPLAAR